ncbi:hypothetical protein Pcinc_021088 [Petrolisthes cinctipes]|uniref:Uncharacterized protein n=1 Tax=Petrolisthes cinctipes TaxID=88211 RepID=A0AAE1FHQ5_PETCI|nr:hypothetical protein Pcinc_021088 [Petrolisthes cinctipes]
MMTSVCFSRFDPKRCIVKRKRKDEPGKVSPGAANTRWQDITDAIHSDLWKSQVQLCHSQPNIPFLTPYQTM